MITMQQEYKVAHTIKERRSIKEFKEDPIPKEVICELLNTAVWAPNHGLREPWRFILFVNEGKEKLIDAIAQESNNGKNIDLLREKLQPIPAHLLVVMQEDPRQKQWEEDLAATSALIQNFQLAAWEKGIGVIWKTGAYIYSPSFRKKVGVEPGEKIVGLLHIGYPASIPQARLRTKAEEKLTVIES
ncbi:nitroreductase [Anoxybacillus rupiensis]|uniref:Putative NAD(P)H nitroreductase n=1 Tax=Anoxybacteroides rupiense TaxID=311460 RepID=A0ABT5W6K0_9BACL|nr:nitroreductase [Anoxybacillus rupiensis]MDE8564963.1 nitroreductase [Anoxybacillus rupiensis]